MLVLAYRPAFAEVSGGVNLAALEGWHIVIPKAATPTVEYAAQEFQVNFARASGITLPIVKTVRPPYRHVFIGAGEAMQASAVGFSVAKFGPEDLRIVVRNNIIVIAGGEPRETLYGVYTFL